MTTGGAIIVDSTAPVVNDFKVQYASASTTTTEVTLNTAATIDSLLDSPATMRFSNDSSTWEPWIAITTVDPTAPWVLDAKDGDGEKTVYAQYRDRAGNVTSMSDTILLDQSGPVGSFTINGGAASTNQRFVDITNSFSDARYMRFKNGDGEWPTTWQTYGSALIWNFPEGDGMKYVYGQFKDDHGNITVASDFILLDMYRTICVTFQELHVENGGDIYTSGDGCVSIRVYTSAGESATFTATVTGGAGSTLAWYVDDAPQAEETGSMFTFVAWPEVQTDYSVKVVATLESRTAEASVSVSVSAPDSPRNPTTWVATTSVPVTNAGMSAVVCDGYLYLVGCRTVNGGARRGVYYAPIGAWTETASLPAGRWLGQSQIIGSRLYYLGGVGVYPGVSVTAYVTEVQADGSLSAWTESTAFTGARAGSSGLYYADTLYLTGGLQFSPGDDFSDIQRITADFSGDLGAWWVNDSGGLPLERYAHYSWEVDGVFWIIGGMKINAATYQGVPRMDVIHAEIGSDHAVSVFETDELGLPVESLSDFGAAYHGGYLYVVGGAVGSTWQSGAFYVAFE